MCESGVCENRCGDDLETISTCPVVEKMVRGFSVPVETERTGISDRANSVIQGIVDGSGDAARSFFGSGWTTGKRA